ncbi:MAG: branched-chain amino acid ABC transporter permease [Nitrospirota bacterium]
MFVQIVINSIIAGAIYTLIALGFNLICKVTRFFNLAHGVYAAVGGYAIFFFYKKLDIGLFLSVPLGVLIAGVTGFLSDKLLFLPLRKRKATSAIMLVASLGLFTALQEAIPILFNSQYKGLRDPFKTKTYEILGGVISEIHILIIASAILISAIVILLINKTAFGKAVKAIGDDEEVAKVIGIDTNRVIGYTFFVGAAIAGVTGILDGFETGLMPVMGMYLLLKGVIASIVGGVGNIYGGIMGSFLLSFAENFGIWKISDVWKDSISFGLLIVFLLFRPRGILGESR